MPLRAPSAYLTRWARIIPDSRKPVVPAPRF